jgi:hypothetical protein
MSEYYGGDYIYSVLNADSALNTLLGQYTDETGVSGYPVFIAKIIPSDCPSRKTVNCYRLDPFDASLEYFISRWSIDCRADDEYESQAIATAVTSALNRVHKIVSGETYFGTVSILSTIPPIDDSDQYNTSVQLLIRRR